MRIKILGSESLGVRGLSCVVETRDRRIVIDPGLALGYQRHGLLPHPFQVAVGETVRRKIYAVLNDCTDIIISHYHGDHVPLADANPFQISAQKTAVYFQEPQLWCKCPHDLSTSMNKRYQDLSRIFTRKLNCSEGKTDGPLSFSQPVPHGEAHSQLGKVMMTRVEDKQEIFIHASDIQLLDDSPIEQILAWKPSIVLASGPPLYLGYLPAKKRKKALELALLLAKNIPVLILDHHMLRNEEGFHWLDDLSASCGRKIYCAADYMQRRRLPLEAWRNRLYQEMPVPEGWHAAYARGLTDTAAYRKWRDYNIKDII
ncbi:MAG: MBL fold metallo-hydrolase [Candidatus Aminicenantes bacterium]|nr:MBL fold metallo-hydrolase [Candidatus Aminicenantes bacterium]